MTEEVRRAHCLDEAADSQWKGFFVVSSEFSLLSESVRCLLMCYPVYTSMFAVSQAFVRDERALRGCNASTLACGLVVSLVGTWVTSVFVLGCCF